MQARPERPALYWWISIITGMTVLALNAFCADVFGWWTARLFWLPPQWLLVVVFVIAVGLHVGEGLYAYQLARRHGQPAQAWLVQTLILGFPSLRLLLRRTRA